MLFQIQCVWFIRCVGINKFAEYQTRGIRGFLQAQFLVIKLVASGLFMVVRGLDVSLFRFSLC